MWGEFSLQVKKESVDVSHMWCSALWKVGLQIRQPLPVYIDDLLPYLVALNVHAQYGTILSSYVHLEILGRRNIPQALCSLPSK